MCQWESAFIRAHCFLQGSETTDRARGSTWMGEGVEQLGNVIMPEALPLTSDTMFIPASVDADGRTHEHRILDDAPARWGGGAR